MTLRFTAQRSWHNIPSTDLIQFVAQILECWSLTRTHRRTIYAAVDVIDACTETWLAHQHRFPSLPSSPAHWDVWFWYISVPDCSSGAEDLNQESGPCLIIAPRWWLNSWTDATISGRWHSDPMIGMICLRSWPAAAEKGSWGMRCHRAGWCVVQIQCHGHSLSTSSVFYWLSCNSPSCDTVASCLAPWLTA